MSTLVVLLPARPRDVHPEGGGVSAAGDLNRHEWSFVLTHNGLSVASHGRAALPLLPPADTLVVVPAQVDVSWHRITVPKAPASKLKAALAGLLEDQLVVDPSAVHLALAPEAKASEEAWVAALDRAWLQACIEVLQSSSRTVDRVSPSVTPSDGLLGHFALNATSATLAKLAMSAPGLRAGASTDAGADANDLVLALCDAQGVWCTPLAGTVARHAVQSLAAQPVRWTATPAASAAAERWLGSPVQVESEAEHSLRAVRSAWNLLQFDLSPTRRGARWGRVAWQAWTSAPWRPVRWGLLSLILVQWVGVNVWAWTQQKALDDLKRAQIGLVQTTHPQVRLVVDAPLQMQRETDALRSAAGVPSVQDLESLLGAVATAWPEGQGPAQGLRFDPGQLTVTTAGWSDAELKAFTQRLQSAAWRVEVSSGRVTLRPPATTTTTTPPRSQEAKP